MLFVGEQESVNGGAAEPGPWMEFRLPAYATTLVGSEQVLSSGQFERMLLDRPHAKGCNVATRPCRRCVDAQNVRALFTVAPGVRLLPAIGGASE